MRVLVTGSGGFIGGHLARVLTERGHEVSEMERNDGASTSEWSTIRHFMRRFEPEVIAHLGANCSTAVSLREPELDFRLNAIGTFNVCEAARQFGNVPVVFTSTCKVIPGADGKLAPLGASKRVAEEYLNLYHKVYDVPVVINRPSTVYGPGQNGNSDAGWFTWFINAALKGKQIKLAGDGSQSRDVLYVSDMVDLLVDQVENHSLYAGGTYAVGGGPANEVSLITLLEILEHSDIQFVPRLPADLDRVVTDNSAVTAINGWRPKVDWVSGMLATQGWLWSTCGQ